MPQPSPSPAGILEEKALDCLDLKRQGYIDLREAKAMLDTFGFGKPSLLYSLLADCERDKKAKEVRHDTFLLALRHRQLSSAQQRGSRGSAELDTEISRIKELQHLQHAAILGKSRVRSVGKA